MADHRPRIVAMIPKKMQIIEMGETDAQQATPQLQSKHKDGLGEVSSEKPDYHDYILQNHQANVFTRLNAVKPTTPDHATPAIQPKSDGNGVRSSDLTFHTAASNNAKALKPATLLLQVDVSDKENILVYDSATRKNARKCQLLKEYMYDEDSPYNYDLVGLYRDIRTAKRNMATLSPKTPKSAVIKTDKEESSIWDKIGTLGRKKRIKEVQEVQEEGKNAIDSPGLPHFPTTSPEDYDLEENEERCMIDQSTYTTNTQFIKLVKVLIDWINDELASQRIIVQDLAEDLYDGQVLQKLLEKLTGEKIDVREVTQSEEGQKLKLHAVLSDFNYVLGLARTGSKKWNVEAIHSKNIVSIMHLLVALARHFRPPVRLTEHVTVVVVIVKKVNGQLIPRTVNEIITTSYDDVGMRCERDAIDSLFDHAPEKLQIVKKSLVTFVNKHLNKINLEVTELETQFHDGVYLTFLMGLLEGFFVPLHSFHATPKDFDQKVHNVSFAFELMEEVGITKLKARPEDIVNQDLKSTLRVLYTLFTKYKNM